MIDFKDVTFIIPIKLDSEDRLNNYRMIINHITSLFNTNIIVCESDKDSHEDLLKIHDSITYMFHKNDTEWFHRTMILNLMTKKSKTNIVCNYDTDVVFHEQQYINAANRIKKGDVMVFPYGGKFMCLPKQLFDMVRENKILEINENEMELAHPQSLGGAFFFNKELYTKAGLENENFVSWGFEDNERVTRLNKLQMTISRVPGILIHLDHERTVNSAPNHPFYHQNMMEYNKINGMDKNSLESYINTWSWAN